MKKILLTTFLLAELFTAKAQLISIGNVTDGFGGLHSIPHSNVVYTYHITDNKADKNTGNLVIYTFSTHLETRDTIIIPVSRTAKPAAVCLNGNKAVVLMADVAKKSLTTIGYEFGRGVLKNTTETGLPSDFFGSGFYAGIYPGMPEGFTILTSLPGKNRGYRLEYLGREFESMWKKNYTPQKGNWDVTSAFSLMEKTVLLRKETSGDKFQFSLIGVISEPGDIMFEKELKEEDDYFYPNSASVSREYFRIAGNYYKNGKVTDKSQGLFFQYYNIGGDAEHSMKVPIEDITQELDPKIALKLQSGDSKIFAHSYGKRPRGFLGVGEIYTVKTGPDEKTLTTGNFITISQAENLDPEHIDSTLHVETQELNGNTVVFTNTDGLSDIELAGRAHERGIFNFRDYDMAGPEGRLLYVSSDSAGNRVRFYTVTDTAITDKAQNIPLDFADTLSNKIKPVTTFRVDLAKPFENNVRLNKNVIPAEVMGRGILFYDYKTPELAIRREELL